MLSNFQTVNPVDALGDIKAQIADLEAQEKALRDMIAELGAGAYDGALFRATVSIADRETIDWRAIAEKLSPSRQLVTAHTSAKAVTTVRVAARK